MIVNSCCGDSLLGPWHGLSDVETNPDYHAFLAIDTKSEQEWRKMIGKTLVPWYQNFDAPSREAIKNGYAWRLTHLKDDDYTAWFEWIEVPADPPPNVKNLFIWIWEECFPGEEYDCELYRSAVNHKNLNAAAKGLRFGKP